MKTNFSFSVTFVAMMLLQLCLGRSALAVSPADSGLVFTALQEGCSVCLNKSGSPNSIKLKYYRSNHHEEGWQSYTVGDAIPVDIASSIAFSATREDNSAFSKSYSSYYYLGQFFDLICSCSKNYYCYCCFVVL